MTAADDARRARQRINSKNYRDRQKAAAATKKPRGATPHGGGVVSNAQAYARELREARTSILRQLPDVRSLDPNNPGRRVARIRPIIDTERAEGPAVKTKAAQQRRASAIRANANAEKLQGIGRRRKNDLRMELSDGSISDQLQEMSPDDRVRFRILIDRITAGSAQSIAILFEHAGGQKLYSAAIERILYKANRSSGFDLLEALAEYAENAAREYAPSKIGRLNV